MEVHVMVMLVLGAQLWDVETKAETVTQEEGRNIKITCSHSNAFTNDKYFCKGSCTKDDILIHTKENLSKEKYSIKDEGNTFYVTISDLTMEDSGVYWCGIDRAGVDTFNRVDLIVTKRTVASGNPSDPNTLSSYTLLYTSASLGVVVVGLAIALGIFIKHRNRDRDGKSTGQDHDPIKSMPCKQRQPTLPDANASTANENLDRDGEMTATSEGELFYSTVSFNKHTDCSAVTTHTPTVTYSVIKHKPVDEITVY